MGGRERRAGCSVAGEVWREVKHLLIQDFSCFSLLRSDGGTALFITPF